MLETKKSLVHHRSEAATEETNFAARVKTTDKRKSSLLFRESLLTLKNRNKKTAHGCVQQLSFELIPDPVKLTAKAGCALLLTPLLFSVSPSILIHNKIII